jgi:hypothetical protein
MRWSYRLLLVAFGLYIAVYGLAKLQQGDFAYQNSRGTVFSPAVIAMGIVLALLGLLPSCASIYRRITTKHETPIPPFHSHRQRSAFHHTPPVEPSAKNPSDNHGA